MFFRGTGGRRASLISAALLPAGNEQAAVKQVFDECFRFSEPPLSPINPTTSCSDNSKEKPDRTVLSLSYHALKFLIVKRGLPILFVSFAVFSLFPCGICGIQE